MWLILIIEKNKMVKSKMSRTRTRRRKIKRKRGGKFVFSNMKEDWKPENNRGMPKCSIMWSLIHQDSWQEGWVYNEKKIEKKKIYWKCSFVAGY